MSVEGKAMTEEMEKLRREMVKLEKRAESLEGRLNEIAGRVEPMEPLLDGSNKLGVPLEIFARLALIKAGFEVHGHFTYPAPAEDGAEPAKERSVDVQADLRSKHIVPANDWHKGFAVPECDHVLREAKQRRDGVRWVFFEMPTGIARNGEHRASSHYGKVVEFRPKIDRNDASTQNVETALWQLELAFMPFLEYLETGAQRHRHAAKQAYVTDVRDAIHLILVTNAELLVFEPPAAFEDLGRADLREQHFRAVDYVLVHREMRHVLREYQTSFAESFSRAANFIRDRGPIDTSGSDSDHKTIFEALAGGVPHIHVVRFDALPRVLRELHNPPHDDYGRRILAAGIDNMRYDPVALKKQVAEYMHPPPPSMRGPFEP